MRPYYEADGITIYHGDCREIVPTLGTADLLLTDPPYGIAIHTDTRGFTGGHRGPGQGRHYPAIVNDDRPFDPAWLLPYGRDQIIWGWNHYPQQLPRGACLVWLKRHDAAFGTFLSDAELAWMSRGHGVYCRRDLSSNSRPEQRGHPTQKPVSLMTWCLGFFPKARTILDPYCGSGTSLVAAKTLGCRAIGIEIVEDYCEIAAERLAQRVLAFG